MRRSLAFAAIALTVIVSACGGGSQKAATTQSNQALGPETRLLDLEHPDRTETLFSLFNADQGVPRLVLLLSPT